MSKGLGEQLTYSGSSLDARETIILQEGLTVDSVITNISNAYPGLKVKVIERLEKSDFTGELTSSKIYEIKKTSNRNKPLSASQGGYELIQEPRDLEYSDGTKFLNNNGSIDADYLKLAEIDGSELKSIEDDFNVKTDTLRIDGTTYGSSKKEEIRATIGAQENIASMADKLPIVAALNDRAAVVAPVTGVVKALGYKVLKKYDPNDANSTFAAQIANTPNTVFEIRDEFNLGQDYEVDLTDTLAIGDKMFLSDAVTLANGKTIRVDTHNAKILNAGKDTVLSTTSYANNSGTDVSVYVGIANPDSDKVRYSIIESDTETATSTTKVIGGVTYYLSSAVSLVAGQTIVTDDEHALCIINSDKNLVLGANSYSVTANTSIYIGCSEASVEVGYTIETHSVVAGGFVDTALNSSTHYITSAITLDAGTIIEVKSANAIILDNDKKRLSVGLLYYNRGDSSKTIYLANTENSVVYNIGSIVEIPNGCTLKFNGGKLSNGTIKANSAFIDSAETTCFSKSIIIDGVLKNYSVPIEWFEVYPYDSENEIDNWFAINSVTTNEAIDCITFKAIYGVSHPVTISSNIIMGNTIGTSVASGLKANADFNTIIGEFKTGNNLLTGIICPIRYSRPTIQNFLVDANFHAPHCIAHCGGTAIHPNIVDTTLRYARHCGILQYACEKPVWESVYITDCNIGIYCGGAEYNTENPIDLSGTDKGANNMLTMNNCRILQCNYGIIKQRGSDWNCTHLETGYNNRCAMYIDNTQVSITDWYSEGDGRCEKWIKPDGTTVWNSNNSTTQPAAETRFKETCKYMIDNNLDGFYYNLLMGKYYYRAVAIAGANAVINVDTLYVSNKRRANYYSNNDIANCADYSEREGSGIDVVILCEVNCRAINVNVFRFYNHPSGTNVYTTSHPYLAFINHNTATYTQNVAICNVSEIIPAKFLVTAQISNIGRYTSLIRKNNIPKLPVNSLYIKDYNEIWKNELTSPNGSKSYFYDHIYIGEYCGVPCYKFNSALLQAGIYKISKTDFINLFGEAEQLGIMWTLHITAPLTAMPAFEIKLYNGNTSVASVTKQPSATIPTGLTSGTYKCVSYVYKNYEYTYDSVRMYITVNSSDYDKVAFSVPQFFEIGTAEENILPITNIPIRRETGTTAKRPATSNLEVGAKFFDTTLGKPIYWNGTIWVDSNGESVGLQVKDTTVLLEADASSSKTINVYSSSAITATAQNPDGSTTDLWLTANVGTLTDGAYPVTLTANSANSTNPRGAKVIISNGTDVIIVNVVQNYATT